MSIGELKSRYKDILAIGIFDRKARKYVEDVDMTEFLSTGQIEDLLIRMEKLNMNELIAVGKSITLLILSIGPERALTCVAPSDRPFGFCREMLHQIAEKLGQN